MNDIVEHILRLAERLGALLVEQRLVLATAESCTAGGIAFAVTQVAGSSGWYDRGFIVYSNEAKQQALGVSPVYLRDFGAVSEPVARAMAFGALTHGQAQIAVAVTGIAGPGGGLPHKPVGLVHIHLAAADAELSERHVWHADRSGNKRLSAEAVLRLILRYLEQKIGAVEGPDDAAAVH